MPGAYATHSLDEVVEACQRTADVEAWDEFVLRTHRLLGATIASTLRRWGRYNTAPLDDVLQNVYLKISADGAAVLRNFQTRHPNAILSYLRAIAVSVASDYCKAANTMKRGSGKDASLSDIDPAASGQHSGGAAGIERTILLKQIDDLLTRHGAESRERTVFWLYYRQGFSANSIALIPALGLSNKGVESMILRLTRKLRMELGEVRIRAVGAPKDIGREKSL